MSGAELQRDKALVQLSSLEDTCRQRDKALAHVAMLQQELNKKAEDKKSLALTVENSQLQQQQLR